MARLSSLQKAERVLRFVLALRNPKISGVLVAHGFQPEDLDEVWTLFRAAAPVSFAPLPPAMPSWESKEGPLREWQRAWLPIIRATLNRHHPLIADAWRLRQRTMPTSQPIRWAMAFVAFHDSLSKATGKPARDAHAALALLAERGLTQAVVKDLRTRIEMATSLPVDHGPAMPNAVPDIEQAVGKLWAWYLEWGHVARAHIHDGRVLRQAGFLSGDRRSKPVRSKPPKDP